VSGYSHLVFAPDLAYQQSQTGTADGELELAKSIFAAAPASLIGLL
jgi:hypothetical protein